LPCSGKEPAKTKRLQRLFTSTHWGKEILDTFLWMKANEKLKVMKAAGERPLCIWDGSVARSTRKREDRGHLRSCLKPGKTFEKAEKRYF
jgi:hypothetical protein